MVFGDVINFVEATPSHADKYVTQLWKVVEGIKELSELKLLGNKLC